MAKQILFIVMCIVFTLPLSINIVYTTRRVNTFNIISYYHANFYGFILNKKKKKLNFKNYL